jgi:hypothetical protein
LSRIKKWHCPYCPQNSARHWNIVVHIKRAHGGIGEPIENGNLSQSVNPGFPGSNGKPAEDMKPPNSYNRYNRPYTNHASKSSKGNEDIIDKMHQTVIELQEKERKMNTIKEFYRRYPDAPMPIPNVDSGNLPIKNMLEQSLPKISCQNEPNNNPSPQMQGHNTNKIASQKTGGNGSLVVFPSHDKDSDPQSPQPVPKNYDDNGDDGIVIVKKDDIDQWGFKVTYTLKYNSLGDVIDAYVTGGLYSYLLKRQRH